MLKEIILKEKMSAMKNRDTDKKNILNILIGELDRISKTPDDNTVIKTVKKLIENNKLTNEEYYNQYLEKYIPKMLNDNKLEIIIKNIISKNKLSGMKGMGFIMKELNSEYIGQFNGKTVSEISKKYLL